MSVIVRVDDINDEEKETKITYETSVHLFLTQENGKEYQFTVAIIYDEIIHPEYNSSRNWLTHYEIMDDSQPLPYAANYLDLECRLTRVLSELSDAQKIEIDKGEASDIAKKIIGEIKKVIKKYEIIA